MFHTLRSLLTAMTIMMAFAAAALAADVVKPEPVFSGPQVGEKIVPFQVVGVYDDQAGKPLDFVTQAGGKPVMLIFMHKLTRPSAALTRSLMSYAVTREADGLHSYVVWLPPGGDKSAAAEYLTRARKSLNWPADTVGIAADGEEGPGAYGLNRNVELTILIAKDNVVTANYALVQPSVTEAPMIAKSITQIIGGEPPTAEQMTKLSGAGYEMKREMPVAGGNELRPLVVAVVQAKDEAERKRAVEAVERYVADKVERQRDLLALSQAMIARGVGDAAVQAQAKRWLERYQPRERSPQDDSKGK